MTRNGMILSASCSCLVACGILALILFGINLFFKVGYSRRPV